MRVTHPYAERGVAPPGAVTVDGTTYPVADDGTVELPDEAADTLVAAWERRFDDYTGDVTETSSGGDETTGAKSETKPVPGTCDTVLGSGDVCGRELPCRYHSDEEE